MIPTRSATADDLQMMADVINPIIRAGGTTAFETPLAAHDLAQITIDNAGIISVFVAVDPATGHVGGFQYLTHLPEPGWGDIASFTQREPRLPGAGRALMARTIAAARQARLTAIRAKIRADNKPGLGYYSAMGFEDYDVMPAVPLADGTPIDRVLKVLRLRPA